MRTYGSIKLFEEFVGDKTVKFWRIDDAEPHVCIRLKNIFPKIPQTGVVPFDFIMTPESSHDLLWFMDRYPLGISAGDLKKMKALRKRHVDTINELERIMLPDHTVVQQQLKNGKSARQYQLKEKEVFMRCRRILNADEMGLGKTVFAIISMLEKPLRPAAVVCDSHLPPQWQEKVEEFTDLVVHQVKGTKPYTLPKADVYIFRYSLLSGWVDVFEKAIFKSVFFDEAQALRRQESDRYEAAAVLAERAEYVSGLSGTPIYNYGDEIFNIMNIIKPGALGDRMSFIREWCDYGKAVVDPKALGTYLRENFLLIRHTREDVGRQLPVVNKIVFKVGYDSKEVKKAEEIARQLALRVLNATSFMEKGQAARDLDWRLREITGISKAREVAAFTRMILDTGQPVLLSGWHRAVYDIWLKELKDFNPVMYTGSETRKQKRQAIQDFKSGKSPLFIISNRSGIGLDGLQDACNTAVIGELDWSPEVIRQLIARLDRDGQPDPVTAYFPVSDYGSDPVLIDLNGLKASQAHNIVDPMKPIPEKFTDQSRMVMLAQRYLESFNK